MICDLAEYYKIYNMEDYSPRYISILACGLRGDSRVYGELSQCKVNLETRLQALMVDNLAWLVWSKTKDAEKGRNKPISIYKELTEEKEIETISFRSAEAFEKARAEILKGKQKDG